MSFFDRPVKRLESSLPHQMVGVYFRILPSQNHRTYQGPANAHTPGDTIASITTLSRARPRRSALPISDRPAPRSPIRSKMAWEPRARAGGNARWPLDCRTLIICSHRSRLQIKLLRRIGSHPHTHLIFINELKCICICGESAIIGVLFTGFMWFQQKRPISF